MMMARPELWTLLALWFTLVDFGAVSGLKAIAIVKNESHPVLFRQKRAWIWNSLYVEEEKPAPIPYKIGQVSTYLYGEGANTIFTVGPTGDLFVTRSLDREEKSIYHLSAKMYDGNNKLVEDSGNFEVVVNDINDNIPVFPKGFNGSVLERSPVGTQIVEVKATDADDPTTANGELRYSLVRGGDGKFQIDDCSKKDLDRESVEQYILVVRAQDMRGLPAGSTATTTVTVSITDINDNIASFTTSESDLTLFLKSCCLLKLKDKDELPNKVPRISISRSSAMFKVEINQEKNGNLMDHTLFYLCIYQVTIHVLDVDEPPVFTRSSYNFVVEEEKIVQNIGTVSATDPDRAKNTIRYSILDRDCPFSIDPKTGVLSTVRPLDRELEATHMFQVKAQEDGSGTSPKVDISVQDINDNKPELIAEDIFLCENDQTNTVLGTLRATDKDEQPARFSFGLASPSSNFTVRDHGNNSADILVKQGPFSLDDSRDYSVTVRVGDGGRPLRTSTTQVTIKVSLHYVITCMNLSFLKCTMVGVSVHALIAILLCILIILVTVILFAIRKRYQKEHLSSLKHSGEIHEQLVTYDEEGGGEMDTNGYDVSILTSACHDGSLLRHPDNHPHPSPRNMAAMIEDKKFEADHDRDGFPYDTLHIYGYEGPESLAGSLSSLDSSSSGSNLDYDFLNDWGPRFRTLAELYGVNNHEYYHQY
uniref:Cadherin-5 n=1 Tax=Periophthalmus magnuspinnatus TaxID=409849 RepID=A0A3B4A5H4_9GOBI